MAEFSTRKITPTDAVKIPAVNENLANPSGYMENDELKAYMTNGLAASADVVAADTGIRGSNSAYDSTATYAKGDFCIYSNVLYQANQVISTPEEWTAAHWDAVDLTTLKAGVDTNADAITSLSATVNTITTETITLNTTAFYSADYAHYVVKNGICEVSIDFKARNNISSYTNLCTLPKPKVAFYLEVPTVSSYSEPIISVGANGNGTVRVNNCSSGKTYFAHFCYIVDDTE